MNDLLAIVLALVGGVLLGAVFFGGLWWTVRQGMVSEYPGLLFSGSLLVRTGVAVAGFYFISNGNWQRLVSCLIGFLLARIVVMRLTDRRTGRRTPIIEEVGV